MHAKEAVRMALALAKAGWSASQGSPDDGHASRLQPYDLLVKKVLRQRSELT
jgi:hypothetical protein